MSNNKRNNSKSNNNFNKKQKISLTRVKKRKKLEEKSSIDIIRQEEEYVEEYIEPTLEFSSKSKSQSIDGSVGSILSLDQQIQSDIQIIDFDCRLIAENDAILRKNRSIPYYQLLIKNPGNSISLDLRKNDLIAKQYKINKLAGTGTFSHVYLCNDIIKKRNVALKIFTIRNQSSLVKSEYLINLHLKSKDPEDRHHFVKMLDTFRIRNQFFLVYECLNLSLYDFMSKIRKQNYTINEIKHISKQMIECLDFLHSNQIIHTDIKPENILFIDPIDSKNQLTSTRIKIIDFGSSIFNSETNYGIVTTRHYRAPEIILDYSWSYPIDVWSVGITVFELFTQVLLFPSVITNLEHVIIMTVALG